MSGDVPANSAWRFQTKPTPCAMILAAAAPAMPISGAPNHPNIRNGVITMWRLLARSVAFIGVSASPAACSVASALLRQPWTAEPANWYWR